MIKKIPNFPGYYANSSGLIYTKKIKGGRGKIGNKLRILKCSDNKDYPKVILCKNGKKYTRFIHRLVLETFIGPCPEGMEACHKNDQSYDNRIDNLEWNTKLSNVKNRQRRGNYKGLPGEKCNFAKLNKYQVRVIKRLLELNTLYQKEIGKIFGVCGSTISTINVGQNWRHL